MTGEMVEAFSHPMTNKSEKAQRELGYKIVPLKEMVKDCYDWMVAEGRI
jgi:nucleoside-diphosphate-sugar epimerase